VTFERSSPEWSRREVIARAGIGLAGGVAGVIAGNVLWSWTRTTGDRFLVDRLVFIAGSTVAAVLLLRVWYRQSARADIAAAAIASGATLWLNEIPFAVLRAILKPTAPGFWATWFGNSDNTLAYAVIYGPCVALALVVAVPVCRTWLSEVLREPRRWALRTRRG
jgi:hypothetical protein